MINQDLFILKEVFAQVKNLGDNKFKLSLILNEKVIDERIDALKKLNESSKKFKEFEQKRNALIADHAELSPQGQPVIYSRPEGKGEVVTNGMGFPNIIKDKETYEEKFKKLNDDNKEVIQAQEKKLQEFQKTLLSEVSPEISLNKISFDDLPEISFDQMKVLMPIINN